MANISCPHCGGVIAANQRIAGREVGCPHCNGRVVMPNVAPSQPPPLPVRQLARSVESNALAFLEQSTKSEAPHVRNSLATPNHPPPLPVATRHDEPLDFLQSISTVIPLEPTAARSRQKNRTGLEPTRLIGAVVALAGLLVVGFVASKALNKQGSETQQSGAGSSAADETSATGFSNVDYSIPTVDYSQGPHGEPIIVKETTSIADFFLSDTGKPLPATAHGYVDAKARFVFHGLVTAWYDRVDGKPVRGHRFKKWESYFRSGKPYGSSVGWRSNGSKAWVAGFKDGLQHGKSTFLFPSGKRISEKYYVDGKEYGVQREWHENGQVAEQYETTDGQTKEHIARWSETGEREPDWLANKSDDYRRGWDNGVGITQPLLGMRGGDTTLVDQQIRENFRSFHDAWLVLLPHATEARWRPEFDYNEGVWAGILATASKAGVSVQ